MVTEEVILAGPIRRARDERLIGRGRAAEVGDSRHTSPTTATFVRAGEVDPRFWGVSTVGRQGGAMLEGQRPSVFRVPEVRFGLGLA